MNVYEIKILINVHITTVYMNIQDIETLPDHNIHKKNNVNEPKWEVTKCITKI